MMNGWELVLSMAIDISEIEAICVRVDGEFGRIPVEQAQHWLSKMTMFTSFEDEGWTGNPTPNPDNDFRFQIWTPQRIFYTRILGGIVVLSTLPRTPEHWLWVTSRTEKELIEIGTGHTWRYGKAND